MPLNKMALLLLAVLPVEEQQVWLLLLMKLNPKK